MAESLQHSILVKDLCQYISINYLDGDSGFILRDTAGLSSNERCFEINGYIPDAIAHLFNRNLQFIIGEAKTIHDIETKHTASQLESFLTYCSMKAHSALLVVAVPWAYHRLARQILFGITKRRKLDDTKFIVPDIFKA
jgi:hypothetical protein